MPSPFPGMDPFLEHPVFFQDLHGAMHTYIREALQSVLPEPYFAVIDERLWVESSAQSIEPDSIVIHSQANGVESHGAATAVAARTQPLVFEVFDDEYRETFVEVRTRLRDENERIVTSIEVLSPSNKSPGEKGRDQYLEKQRELLNSDIHLVEIDLLRGGEHTTPMALDRLQLKAGAFDYHVSVHRFDDPGRFYVYPWRLEVPLPEITVPLLPGDGEVLLDLQAVFTRCYDTGPYRRRVRYIASRLDPPLDAERTGWVKQVIGGSATPDSKSGNKKE
jgi:hypothetical protein